MQDRRSNEHIGHTKFLRQDARGFDFARVMPAADELSDKDAACLMSEALAVMKDNFAPEHLPKCQNASTTTCCPLAWRVARGSSPPP